MSGHYPRCGDCEMERPDVHDEVCPPCRAERVVQFDRLRALTASDREPVLAIVGTRPPHNRSDLDAADWASIQRDVKSWLAHRLTQGRFVIVTGGADGVDAIAESFSHAHRLTRIVVTPNYDEHEGKRAPLERNTRIARICDEMHAWPKRTRGGTDDAIAKCKAMGRNVIVHTAWAGALAGGVL